MHRETETSEPHDAVTSPSATPASARQRNLTIAAAAATGLTFAALLWIQTGHDSGDRTPPAAEAAPLSAAPAPATKQPSPPAPPSSPAAAPDPLTSASAPTGGDPKVPDHTGKSRSAATRTLTDWSARNPAGRGEHAVGGAHGTGPGGRIGEVLRIPALGADWAQPVYDGVNDKQLRSGIGHFPRTEEPGQIGNFALAGHRSGVADPAFRDIDRIRPGAAVRVTTATRITYTYTVTRIRTVAPTDVNVIAQVPGRPDATPTKATLTLVTCWPATGHSKRVIVEANLVSAKGGA
ncbi:sortase [Streptomyces sp. CAU 1734]|uniref:sortase n=1 Tax=Streptomyces sp. CAU 1734 TaxID=3140360 RepID=UPI0032603EF3